MYYRGLGTSTDHSLAFLWYKKAAGNGNKIAQKHIAAMYEMGDGTAISKSEADIWQKKADQNK
jgi:TPR repeat protein